MIIKSAEFKVSVASADKIPDLGLPEFAFVGRSNVGKSSLINALCNRSKLARTSSLPGRTRLINYFEINKEVMLVDLPGYGFAKASKIEQEKWQSLIGEYLMHNKNLKKVFVLLDIRHEPNEKDEDMINYLSYFNIPFVIVATKLDKIKPSQVVKQKQLLANKIGVGMDNIIVTSAELKKGLDKIWEIIKSE
ncbi:MAG: YihA family ribosome biogenesis GTP-binding protein [Clostridia bacterium]|nr:YihA family ribosome biogenesis GTP-binding protein [Clostridia bacterium]